MLDLDAVRSFEVYPDDVFVITQPKCGTTWMQELSWLISNNLDLEGAKVNQFYRVPFFDYQALIRWRVNCMTHKILINRCVIKVLKP